MTDIFCRLLNMSITGSVAILVVLVARRMMSGQRKIFACIMWLVVIFRLLCPVSLSSAFSLFNTVKTAETRRRQIEYIIVENLTENRTDNIQSPAPEKGESNVKIEEFDLLDRAAKIWAAVAAIFLAKNLLDYLRLKLKLKGSHLLYENVYCSRKIDSPFVLGYLSPAIYLPENLSIEDERAVVRHEKQHIASGHIYIKLAAFLALCLHWFNPLVWLCYCLLEKDMEMACDEAVIDRLGSEVKAEYSQSLLNVTCRRGRHNSFRLSFGESEVKERVINIMNFKKTTSKTFLALCLAAGIVCAVLALNPDSAQAENPDATPAKLVENLYFENPRGGKFHVSFELPKGWKLEAAADKPQSTVVLGEFTVFDENSREIGNLSAYTYTEYEGAEKEPMAIYNQIALANHYQFDCKEAYTVVKSDDTGDVARTNVYRSAIFQENAGFERKEKNNIGILAYDSRALCYVAIELDSDIVTRETADEIAMSLEAEKYVEEMGSTYVIPEGAGSEEATSGKLEDFKFTLAGFFPEGTDWHITREYSEEHGGIDLRAPEGTDIIAPADGTVIRAIYSYRGAGVYLTIDHGEYITQYEHCLALMKNVGDQVKKGDVIAQVGSTGNSTGYHLHFSLGVKSDETGLSSGYSPEELRFSHFANLSGEYIDTDPSSNIVE